MPYPKRRSCLNCVHAKRKCNLDTPQCQRCSEKGILCDYSNASTVFITTRSHATSNAPTAAAEPTVSSIEPPSITFPRFPTIGNEENTLPMEFTPFDTSINDPAYIEQPALDFDDFVDRPSISNQFEEGSTLQAWAVYKPRISYSVSRIKNWPTMFAQRSMCPFIHRSSFAHVMNRTHGAVNSRFGRSEDVMLDVLSACALYSMRNEENQGAVIQDIRRKAENLVEGMASARWERPEEILVSLQALLLYQIIRLFDGDVRLRTEAEVHEVVRARWTMDLMKHLRVLNAPDTIMNGSGPCEANTVLSRIMGWRSWVFDESVRRTILASYLIQENYSFLQEKAESRCRQTGFFSFTAQKALWEAPSEYHWNALWTEKLPYEINIRQWDADITGMSIDDSDELGVILMALIKDLDQTTRWVGKDNLGFYGMDWKSMVRYLG